MPLDPDKVEAYDALSIMFGRSFLTLVLGACIVGVLVFLCRHPNWPMATLEAVLAGTCYKMVTFYFPPGRRKTNRPGKK